MDNYNVAPFYAKTFARPSGPIIWNFLNEERTIGKMEAASFYSRPSVEPLASDLLALDFPEEIGAEVLNDTCGRMIGHMVRQVMEAQGYAVIDEDVPMSGNALFLKGACYGQHSNK
jgi:hypothetical protein